MANPWFRLYSEIISDEKLLLLAFEDRWHYIAILALKSADVLDPTDPLLARKIAVKLGVQLTVLDEIKRRLMDVGLIDADWQPTGWAKRQFVSDKTDPTAAKRMRTFREKNRKKEESTVTDRNDTVTLRPPEADTDTDTEKEKIKTKREDRATRLSHDWTPSPEDLSFCREHRPDLKPTETAERFRDHWIAQPGAKGRKLDWHATWRNWVRNERKANGFQKPEPHMPQPFPRSP